jgi:phosphatidylserine decarboxylase
MVCAHLQHPFGGCSEALAGIPFIKVYPANEFGLRYMRGVLSRNERLVTYVQHEFGEIAVVKVGQ